MLDGQGESPDHPEGISPRCRECGRSRGHLSDCGTGRKELEEWKRLFGGRVVEVPTEDIEQPKGMSRRTPSPRVEVSREDESTKEPVTHALPERLQPIRTSLIHDAVKFSYDFATSKGRIRLQEVIRERRERPKEISKLLSQDVVETLKSDVRGLLTEQQRAQHFEKMKNFIRSEFDRVFKTSGLSIQEQHEIISDIVRNLEDYLGDIEKKDEGAIKILKNIVARMFLSGVEIKELYRYLR